MLIRRLAGLYTSSLSSGTAAPWPITRIILSSLMPPAMSSRRDALARSAESSQLL
jgi:hypothetical protein